MKIKLVAGAAIGAAFGAYVACTPAQPKPSCPVAHGGFAAKYTVTTPAAPGGACSAARADELNSLAGDEIGLERYFAKNEGGASSVAIRTNFVGAHVSGQADEGRSVTATTKSLAAWGEMKAEDPDATNFCYVDTLSATSGAIAAQAAQPLPDGGTDPALPAEAFSETWSNLKIYATANATGTQIAADYQLTADGCTAKYKVTAIWPVVGCENPDTGDADDSLCQNYTDVGGHVVPPCGDHGCLNLDFKSKCDPTLKLCVAAGDIPSFTAQ